MNLSNNDLQNGFVIFDMDGVLIDSEPFWQEAEIEIFKTVNIELDANKCRQTTGMRMDMAVEYWFQKYPWNSKTKIEVENEVKNLVCQFISKKASAKPGAIRLVNELKKWNIPMAICSSSPMKIIHIVCEKLGFSNTFQVLQSAEDCKNGKPHPEPYLATAKRLNAIPNNCIVIEDSLMGAISGKSAGMKVIAVPEEKHFHQGIFDFCDAEFKSLEDVTFENISMLLKKVK